ncbi:uncharacterized protein [Physcomitrium patens]|uniref:Dof-type domain-containing protein n=1 Tax=Physcomitrium patens TaxID=3218 RepID=A0A2K1KFI3_PHYPA|nr:dof zinc finger protein DOF2.5-like [Physcomitrium patens]PNR52523.1 hypothetical protein PHYPA_008897 [Physcomitrium patens]|eukprot:XP_024377387.1 dof zinc finger protein DOF2.5-like [Physcomitrella patens]
MHLPVNHQILLGDFEDDSNEELDARIASSGSGSGGGDSPGSSRGNGGCIRSRPVKVIPCPRCQSMNTKFCYYNNYSVNQPRHFCRNCQRYWTVGGTLRNVPVGGGSRKKIRTRNRNDTYLLGGTPQTSPVGSLFGSGGDLLSSSACMQQLSMLPPTGGMLGFGNQTSGFAPAVPPLPYLQFALEYTQGLHPSVQKPLAGLQEVPDIQSLYDTQASQAPQVNSSIFNSSSSLMLNSGVTLPTLHAPSHSDTLPSVMAKTGLWTVAAQQLPSLNGTTQVQSSWQDKQSKPSMSSQLQHRSGYVERMNPINHMNAIMFPHNVKPGSWEAALMHSRPVMNDRLVPHTSWDENQSSTHTNLSPNASSTTDDERCPSNNCFPHTYEDVSQSWVDLQASDALSFQ